MFKEPLTLLSDKRSKIKGSSDISSDVELQLVLDKGVTFLAALRKTWVSTHDEGVFHYVHFTCISITKTRQRQTIKRRNARDYKKK